MIVEKSDDYWDWVLYRVENKKVMKDRMSFYRIVNNVVIDEWLSSRVMIIDTEFVPRCKQWHFIETEFVRMV